MGVDATRFLSGQREKNSLMPISDKKNIPRDVNREFMVFIPSRSRSGPTLFDYMYPENTEKIEQHRLYELEQRIDVTKRERFSVMHHVPILMPPEEALRRSLRIKVMQLMAELDAGREQASVSLRKILFSEAYDVDKDLEKIILARLVMEGL